MLLVTLYHHLVSWVRSDKMPQLVCKGCAFILNKPSNKVLIRFFLQLLTHVLVVCVFLLNNAYFAFVDCAGCGRDIKNGQALLALDKQWHLGCFKCKACNKVLTGEYISK